MCQNHNVLFFFFVILQITPIRWDLFSIYQRPTIIYLCFNIDKVSSFRVVPRNINHHTVAIKIITQNATDP